jgi:hypothetical protein
VEANYTWSKSIDLASAAERSSFGVIMNPFDRRAFRAVSDYDMTHQFNLNWVYNLPFGHGAGALRTLFGGWQVSGLYRQTSGLPTYAGASGVWPTNWNLESGAVLRQPVTAGVFRGAGGGPNLFPDAGAALKQFDYCLPGCVGDRNNLRGDGLFNIDVGLAKRFAVPRRDGHSVQLRWETFNVTNTARFDPGYASLDISTSSSFGRYTTLLTNPRVMQFALRYEF